MKNNLDFLSRSTDYFNNITDANGIIQFTNGYERNFPAGYAIEDQARALLVSLLMEDKKKSKLFIQLLRKSLTLNGVKMIWYQDGHFSTKEDYFSEASAEVLWAIGEYSRQFKLDKKLKDGVSLLKKDLIKTPHTRVLAYAILGLTKLPDSLATQQFAARLIEFYQKNATDDWPWFEENLYYGNALLPWALIEAYKQTKKKEYKEVGLKTLNFLFQLFKHQGKPIVIGNKGWMQKGGRLVLYDQQPIDIAYLVLCCIAVYELTGEKRYLQQAVFYYNWFLGDNLLGFKMIREDGACFDGLSSDGPSINSGAESHICFLLASLTLSLHIPKPLTGDINRITPILIHSQKDQDFQHWREQSLSVIKKL